MRPPRVSQSVTLPSLLYESHFGMGHPEEVDIIVAGGGPAGALTVRA
jgi:hypothetical protein